MLLKKEMSTSEIDTLLKDKNDFVKIDHLTRFLQEKLPAEIRKFSFMRLGEVYERSFMFVDSARAYEMAGELSSENDKKNMFIKSAQLFIRGGDFTRAEGLIRNAMSKANDFERKDIYEGLKRYCIYSAEAFEKAKKVGDAIKIYEKVLTMELSDSEKKQVKTRLMELYQRLGKVKEYMALKNNLER
jgi:tetratricopeptide (TPR) repeat protein